jgi:hypothetical protein
MLKPLGSSRPHHPNAGAPEACYATLVLPRPQGDATNHQGGRGGRKRDKLEHLFFRRRRAKPRSGSRLAGRRGQRGTRPGIGFVPSKGAASEARLPSELGSFLLNDLVSEAPRTGLGSFLAKDVVGKGACPGIGFVPTKRCCRRGAAGHQIGFVPSSQRRERGARVPAACRIPRSPGNVPIPSPNSWMRIICLKTKQLSVVT